MKKYLKKMMAFVVVSLMILSSVTAANAASVRLNACFIASLRVSLPIEKGRSPPHLRRWARGARSPARNLTTS